MEQDFAEKIAKLLAMAERTDNPAEAEVFTEKAETLMLQRGIEQAEIDSHKPGDKKEEIVVEHIRFRSPFYQPLGMLGSHIGPSFNIKGYRSNDGVNNTHIWLIGHKSDVESATTLIHSLVIQGEAAVAYWFRTEGDRSLTSWNQFVQKRQFLYAFGSGVRERLSEVRNRVVKEAGTGTELMMVDRGKLVDNWTRENMRFSKGRGSAQSKGGYDAQAAGHRAGLEAVGVKAVKS